MQNIFLSFKIQRFEVGLFTMFLRPCLTTGDFYHAFHNNYFDIVYQTDSKKVEKDYGQRNNFYFEFIRSFIPKCGNWVSRLSPENHWTQNIISGSPKGLIDMVVFCPLLFKLPVFQDQLNKIPYSTKYMVGFFERPSEWKIKTTIFAVENMRPYFDIYTQGIFYLNLSDYSLEFIPIAYKRSEMLNIQNKIVHWKRFHKLYETNLLLFPRWAYPNFARGESHGRKLMIGRQLGEISQLYFCKEKIRKKCHDNGIYSYYDDAFVPFLEKNISKKIFDIVARILKAQKKNDKSWFVIEDKIRKDKDYIFLSKTSRKYYIDFETDAHQNVYLIGILSSENEFTYFWGDVRERFSSFLELNKDAVFVYYKAEKKFMKKLCGLDYDERMLCNWIDVCPLLTNYCAFEGAYDFKLKSIQKSFFEHDVLQEEYSEDCSNGLKSIQLYEDYCESGCPNLQQHIIHYNYLDCSFMKNITDFVCLHA